MVSYNARPLTAWRRIFLPTMTVLVAITLLFVFGLAHVAGWPVVPQQSGDRPAPPAAFGQTCTVTE
jgi:hypothetical protein